jgi:hypothetical protein
MVPTPDVYVLNAMTARAAIYTTAMVVRIFERVLMTGWTLVTRWHFPGEGSCYCRAIFQSPFAVISTRAGPGKRTDPL